jgi:hypothetical protein
LFRNTQKKYTSDNHQLFRNTQKKYTSDNHQLFRNTQTQQITNTYGKNILELCIGSQLKILNGRTIGDSSGKATYFNYNGVTINDYC